MAEFSLKFKPFKNSYNKNHIVTFFNEFLGKIRSWFQKFCNVKVCLLNIGRSPVKLQSRQAKAWKSKAVKIAKASGKALNVAKQADKPYKIGIETKGSFLKKCWFCQSVAKYLKKRFLLWLSPCNPLGRYAQYDKNLGLCLNFGFYFVLSHS